MAAREDFMGAVLRSSSSSNVSGVETFPSSPGSSGVYPQYREPQQDRERRDGHRVSKEKGTVLLIDDLEDQCALYQTILEREGFIVKTTVSPQAALGMLEGIDAVVTDLHMEEMSGLELCRLVHEVVEGLPVVLLTGVGSMEIAIEALRVGVYDFLVKPANPKLLLMRVGRAAAFTRMSRELARLRAAPAPEQGLIGKCAAWTRVKELLERVSKSEASILIRGETGTGKELVARHVHRLSRRTDGPLVAINCAALPPTLLESELFGHARGAFTDAKGTRDGLFVQATGGTLFLDEIGEMPLDMQVKLLRALQEHRVRPVGASAEVPFDARIVCATHRNLEEMVAAGTFREDLYYRLNVVSIDLPPLRDRGDDILELAVVFLSRAASRNGREMMRLSTAVAERLVAYDWPGNVRELENCIERCVALARFHELAVEDLPERIRAHRADRILVTADDPQEIVTLENLSKRYVSRVVTLVGGNKSRAADLLGLDRRTLTRRLKGLHTAESSSMEGGPTEGGSIDGSTAFDEAES